ncbi:Uncharacterized protein PECH_005792 [Penicillium ucsense]|uniref:HECT-type E3 ubiquitin transferase n=1 Tax=Penicillium ucsense TaxID=2839758 RepID=A0A8J8W8X4_9EURO|nr:Uncharacterized protein PECM_003245 [Penicillium ucsense]KAF7736095.1 Uncharacterized protein PECH_005792 [Penicillium ucsense]
MFQSFTGSSRRPRQVNLSGRSNNPFAAFPGSSTNRNSPHAGSPQSAVAIAQQERIQRQRERERRDALRIIQRCWRGYRSRKATHSIWRVEWDENELQMKQNGDIVRAINSSEFEPVLASYPTTSYGTADQCLTQLRLLVQFASSRRNDDVLRLVYFVGAFESTFRALNTIAVDGEWTSLLKRLARTILFVLRSTPDSKLPISAIEILLRAAMFLTSLLPKQMATLAEAYYEVMGHLTTRMSVLCPSVPSYPGIPAHLLQEAVLALLRPITSETMSAYESFAFSYLRIPSLESYLGNMDHLAGQINYRMLALAISSRSDSMTVLKPEELQAQAWLLSYLIYFQQHTSGTHNTSHAPELEFVTVVSDLLTSTAAYLVQGLETDEGTDNDTPRAGRPLDSFIRDQVNSLITQSSVTGLLSRIRSSPSTQYSSPRRDFESSKEARVLAKFALNLLRIFPRRGDDIRMWLFLGSAPSTENTPSDSSAKIPAIKYFWRATRSSRIFQVIRNDSMDVLPLLVQPSHQSKETSDLTQDDRDQEWTTILLFLELYTFVLKVMDDDEFFSTTSSFTVSDTAKASWTRESALPLGEVKEMTLFLKNLAFTLYWNAADLSNTETGQARVSLSSYFSSANHKSNFGEADESTSDLEQRSQPNNLPGVTGIPLDYFKGLVTGLLRMLHERDSRRKFLPKDHWLMTTRFDMEGFIPTVVGEEERRHEYQARAEEEGDPDLAEDTSNLPVGLAGTSHAQHTIRLESLRRHQQKVARSRVLAAIAPRLEILRNMPFFIPFETRVQIFREFIYHDQYRRRRGYVDPDQWRASLVQLNMAQMTNGHQGIGDNLARHQAEIRRDNVFDDAMAQFYPLGEGLKEPIQISFIDQFGAVEAGIDGGGVTKEFLTSITSEAFKTAGDFGMFVDNDQHLLYPNPTVVEQCKARLRENGVAESNLEWSEQIRDLLRRYEFLGRIIGKCLYEGILVDVNFAPFFLLKWALTGGISSALRESSYRANLNDLKDLDQGLYQGLLQLKNYSGDVEDFSLDFTVTDNIPVPGSQGRIITKELRHNGAQIPVTNQNRLVYISYVARYRLQVQPALQTNAFLQGLGQIIQPAWLSMFNQSELQTLVSGETGDIDVEDLRRNTQYGGVYAIGDDNQEHPTIQLFWKVMREMNNEERQKVIRFVTSTPRAPLLGFSHLNPHFSIRDSSDDQERLPSTSTCVNLLKLPRYSTAEILRNKLLYAVSSGAGFDLS